MINLGNIYDENTFKKAAIYYNISSPVGLGLINYTPDPITVYDTTSGVEYFPSDWLVTEEFEVDFYKGRYLGASFTIIDDILYMESAPWLETLSDYGEIDHEEAEDILDELSSGNANDPKILTLHQKRMLILKDVLEAMENKNINQDGVSSVDKIKDIDICNLMNEKVEEMLTQYINLM
jgi:hypothetical protein